MTIRNYCKYKTQQTNGLKNKLHCLKVKELNFTQRLKSI